MINVTNVRAALDRVETHIDEWDQRYYSHVVFEHGKPVRYLACFAGHAAILAGDPPDWSRCTRDHPKTLFTVSDRLIPCVADEFFNVTEVDEFSLRLYSATLSLAELRRDVARLERVALLRAS